MSKNFPLRTGLFSRAFLLLAFFHPPLNAAPVLGHIKCDNFGYRPGDEKIAYFTADPGSAVELHNADTSKLVYTTTSITFKGTDNGTPKVSGDSVWWVDFSPFTKPGWYYLYCPKLNEQSYNFRINHSVYQAPMKATLKALYYQRCGTPKPASYAGIHWSDNAPCHAGDAACKPSSGCHFPMDYGTLDLSGGWHDAGDYNKYIGVTPPGACDSWGGDSGEALCNLLTAYEWNPSLFPDKQTNIPESGNGVSDLLDECKWELDWYLKMQMKDKHVLSVVHSKVFTSGSPPSTDPTVRYYYPPNPERGEPQFVAVLCRAARVMSGVPGLANYATTLRSAAEETWNKFSSAWPTSDTKFWAATEIFHMEDALGGPASILMAARNLVDGYKPGHWKGAGLLETQHPLYFGVLTYLSAKDATKEVTDNMRVTWGHLVDDIFNLDDLYHSGMRNSDYYWSSNEVKKIYATELVWGIKLGATGSHTSAECLRHAEDFLHYLNGANPLNMTYMTNSNAIGASHGVWRVFHYWFGNYNNEFSYSHFMGKPASVVDPLYPYFEGVDNYGISDSGPSSFGPPPGIVPDGPTYEYKSSHPGKAQPPLLAGGEEPPIEKEYRDWNWVDPTGEKTEPWIVNETGVYYISSYTILASIFTAPSTP